MKYLNCTEVLRASEYAEARDWIRMRMRAAIQRKAQENSIVLGNDEQWEYVWMKRPTAPKLGYVAAPQGDATHVRIRLEIVGEER